MPNTGESAGTLLLALTDDELARYGEVARDQAAHELRNWGLQAALAVAAVGCVAWAWARWGAGIEAAGLDAECFRCVAAWFAIALALGYWPYRRVKNWSLWQRHVKAVNAERARRKDEQVAAGRIAAQ